MPRLPELHQANVTEKPKETRYQRDLREAKEEFDAWDNAHINDFGIGRKRKPSLKKLPAAVWEVNSGG